MKKWAAVGSVAALLAIGVSVPAFADDPIHLVVNGKLLHPDVPAQIVNNRTIAPVRSIAEALGANVAWDGDTNTVTIETTDSNNIQVDQHYLFALKTANQFLMAWENRDSIHGQDLITDQVKQQYTSEQIQSYFVGLSNPHHQAFEIMGERRIDDNTIRFQVWMYQSYSGETPLAGQHPSPAWLDVVNAGNDQWLANNLP